MEYSAIVARVWMTAYTDFLPALQGAVADGKAGGGARAVVDKIAGVATAAQDKPAEPVVVEAVSIERAGA